MVICFDLSIEQIAQALGLSVEEVRSLRSNAVCNFLIKLLEIEVVIEIF
ncbi:hypothetical protein [Nostoc sp.]